MEAIAPSWQQTFIDREQEQKLFERLLLYQDAARILAIGDKSGMGKTRLLQMFRHTCRTRRPKIPVSLIDLRTMTDHDPLTFARQVMKDFADFDVTFPGFKQADSARRLCDIGSIRSLSTLFGSNPMPNRPSYDSYSPYEHGLETLLKHLQPTQPHYKEALAYEHRLRENIHFARTTIDTETRRSERAEVILQLNTLTQATLGQSFNTLCQRYAPPPSLAPYAFGTPSPMEHLPFPNKLTDEQDELAREVCLNAFFEDMHTHHQDRPLVLLVDSFEYCREPLKTWWYEHFLEPFIFDPDKRLAKLIVVVAGQQMPQFESYWRPAECAHLVCSVHQMGTWTRTHVEECLRVYGLARTPQTIDTFHNLVVMGTPLSHIIQVIMALVGQGKDG